MIEGGELQRRVASEGLTGVTANPAIFRAALHASGAYDRQIRELAVHPLNGIYEALIVADVRDACDILRPVYDRTEGRDGFVSLEVSPDSATHIAASTHETAQTRRVKSRQPFGSPQAARSSRRTICRMPPWRKYSTSAGASIRTSAENPTRDPSCRVTVTFAVCRGVMPAAVSAIEKASKPVRPSDCAEAPGSNCNGRIPMQTRLLR